MRKGAKAKHNRGQPTSLTAHQMAVWMVGVTTTLYPFRRRKQSCHSLQIDISTIHVPTIDIPTIDVPTIDIPKIDISTFMLGHRYPTGGH